MATFADSTGRQWLLELTVSDLKRVRTRVAVDLANPHPETLVKLAMDIVAFVDVLYVLCEPQAKERAISDEDFARLLGGEVAQQANTAFWEALSDFFRLLGRREVVQTIAKQQALVRAGIDEATRQIEEINTEQITMAMRKASTIGSASTAGPGYSALIPDHILPESLPG